MKKDQPRRGAPQALARSRPDPTATAVAGAGFAFAPAALLDVAAG